MEAEDTLVSLMGEELKANVRLVDTERA